MKLATVLFAAVLGSDTAWYWYTDTVLTVKEVLPLLLLAALTFCCGLIGWIGEDE